MKLQLERGKSTTLDWKIEDTEGNPVDLTSKAGSFILTLNNLGTDTITLTKALTITDATKGFIEVTIDDTESVLTPAIYDYIVEIDWDTDETRVYDTGTLEITGDDTTRLDEIKKLYGLTFDYATLSKALNYAHQQLKNNAFVSINKTPMYTDSNNVIKINNYIADSNFDGVVNSSEFAITQFMQEYPYTTADITANISSVTYDHPTGFTYIEMDDSYPSNGYSMQVEYYQIQKPYAGAEENIKYVEELYTIFHLFDTLEPYKLQQGIPNKSINGVSIEFDRDGVAQYKLQLFHQIHNEIVKFRKINFRNVNINKVY